MTRIKILKEEDKIKDLGVKICRFAKYYEKGEKGRSSELATLADVLSAISRILKDHDERFKELEKYNLEYHGINETGGMNNIKIVLDNPNKKRKEIV